MEQLTSLFNAAAKWVGENPELVTAIGGILGFANGDGITSASLSNSLVTGGIGAGLGYGLSELARQYFTGDERPKVAGATAAPRSTPRKPAHEPK